MSSASCVNQVSVSEPLQGIGSILGFEGDQKPKYKTTTTSSGAGANSLRRTLSADMSSKKWFSSPLKKIASSDELQIAAADADIQQQQPGQLDIWCSILIQNPSSLPPPYVHPLVKQSKSSLTMKSLEICTENLGSESSSDGFSSYPPSEISYSGNEEQEEIQEEEAIEEEVVVEEKKIAKVVELDNKQAATLTYSKKLTSSSSSVQRSFPPPLNSLSRPGGGIQMKPHRKDGRLVLEAVSVPSSQNCFHAQRQHGRLVLTFASPVPQTKSSFDSQHVEEDDEIEKEEPIMEDEEEEDRGIVLEMSSRVPKLPTGVINVHRSALMVNGFTGLTNNKNSPTTWSPSNHIHLKNKSEKMIIDQVLLLPQSLPSSPPTLAAGAQPRMSRWIPPPPPPPQQTIAAVEASSFNTYEYSWRRDTSSMVSVSGIPRPLNQISLPNTKNIYYDNNSNNMLTRKNNYYINNNNLFARDSTVKGGKDFEEEKHNGEEVIVDHMVVPAYSKACKQEPRRALLFWEPYCIATS